MTALNIALAQKQNDFFDFKEPVLPVFLGNMPYTYNGFLP